MVSKHDKASKDSIDSDFSTDSPSTASTPDLDDSSCEPKSVVWQRNISGSVKARINDLESQAQKTVGVPRTSFSPTLPKSLLPKALSLDRPTENGDSEVTRKCTAVKSRPYKTHHSAQLLRSKTMPSVLLQKLVSGQDEPPQNEAIDPSKFPVAIKKQVFPAHVRTSWSSPRATSIDEGSQNLNYNAFESLGITKSGYPNPLSFLPLRKSFNSASSFQNLPTSTKPDSLNGCAPKPLLLHPEPTPRATRSLTPEFPSYKPPIGRPTNIERTSPSETVMGSFPANGKLPFTWDQKLEELRRKYLFVNEKTVFRVGLEKNSRGLGIGIYGGRDSTTVDNWSTVFIRIKRLYPLQPALECGQLKVGDIILRVNEHHLTDLSHHEAVEALRVAAGNVFLLICRPSPGTLPPLPLNGDVDSKALGSLSSVTNFRNKNPMSNNVAFFQNEEFEVELEKCNGSLGFTLVNDVEINKNGHFIKELVKDPAVSDGRLKPGDQILMVNDIELNDLSHEEAIQCLRKSPNMVRLLLLRPLPSSPLTPPTLDDSNKDKKVLRKEAQDLLSDKFRRKSFESNSNSTCSSSGRRQRLKGYNSSNSLSVDSAGDQSTTSNSDVESRRSTPTPTECFRVPNVRSYLSQEALDAADSSLPALVPPSPTLKTQNPNVDRRTLDKHDLSSGSVPSLQVSAWDTEILAAKDPQMTSSESKIAYVNGDNNLKSFQLSPSSSFRRVVSCDGVASVTHSTPKENFTAAGLKKWRGTALENGHIYEKETLDDNLVKHTAWEMMIIDLNKEKNERLGFTLMAVEVGSLKGSFVKAVQSGGLAKEDGRIKPGDHLVTINGISTVNTSHSDVIEILRNQRGRVRIEVERHPVVSSLLQNLIELSLV